MLNIFLCILKFKKDIFFKVEEDRFEATTPFGMKTFTNIIVWPEEVDESDSGNVIILAAHYDSKFFEVCLDQAIYPIK